MTIKCGAIKYILPMWILEANYIKAKRFHDGYESYGFRGNIGFTDVKWADSFMVGLALF